MILKLQHCAVDIHKNAHDYSARAESPWKYRLCYANFVSGHSSFVEEKGYENRKEYEYGRKDWG